MVSAALIIPLAMTSLAPLTLAQAEPLFMEEITKEVVTIVGVRTNLVFLEGEAGDTHLVYTYEQDGLSYMVVDDATEDFSHVYSTVYVLDSHGTYTEDSTLELSANSEGSVTITFEETDGTVETQMIVPQVGYMSSRMQGMSGASSVMWEWITDYYDGSTHITNYTITAIIGALTAVATRFAGPVIAGSLGSVAQTYFSQNATWAYYHKINNWRHSERNYLVIEQTDCTNWYSNSAHTNYLGYTYTEYFWN